MGARWRYWSLKEVSSANLPWINLPVGYGRSWNLSLELCAKLRLKLFHSDHLWLVGMLRGGMGSMTRSSIHWRQDPASQSTKCSEEISPGRTMASSGQNGQTFGLHLKRRLAWSAFYYFTWGVNMFFQGTCFFLYWMFRVTYPCWWGAHGGMETLEDPEEKRGRGVSKQDPLGETYICKQQQQ